MKLTVYISLVAAACSALVAAAPTGDVERAIEVLNELEARGEGDRIQIEKRTPGSKQDPIKITVDCTGVEQVCQADCVAYLCFAAPRLLKRDMQHRASHNQYSGASTQPGQGTAQEIATKHGLTRAYGDNQRTSFEETTFESAGQGGWGCIGSLVITKQNTDHGSRLSGRYSAARLQHGQWFWIEFTGFTAQTIPECWVMQNQPQSGPQWCAHWAQDPNHPVNHQYRRNPVNKGPNGANWFDKLRYGTDTWANWYYWNNPTVGGYPNLD